MKKYIIIVSVIVAALMVFDICYYYLGWYLPFSGKVEAFVKTEGKDILIKDGDSYRPFTIKGVDLGASTPKNHSNDYKIDKETYLRWFSQMQKMGANTVRVYTVLNSDFYDALYEYNKDNDTPLYILQGVWFNDYLHNSHRDSFDSDFVREFKGNCKSAVDAIHGRKKIALSRNATQGSGNYLHDISQWVLGYIVGVDWTDTTVAYTNEKYKNDNLSYTGEYMSSAKDATPFEVMLAEIGDLLIEYETKKYKNQRLIAFSNYPQTDPFTYPEEVEELYAKCARIDAEHIKTTDKFIAGHFASYHVYNYQTHILDFVEDIPAICDGKTEAFYDENGALDTYRTYIQMLNDHHKIPVVISEFGISTARGSAYEYNGTNSDFGFCSEEEQGRILEKCWSDITQSGSAGGCIFEWQDEWCKRTWNTLYAVNTQRSQFWSDYQTGGQSFGLLSFDPGSDKSVSYTDGNTSEWTKEDIVSQNGEMSLSVKYDEKFIYFMVNKKNLDFENDKIYIPLDITPKSGSNYCKNYGVKFDREADFVIAIDGYDNSRVVVQERYEAARSTYALELYGYDTYRQENIPDKNSPEFVNINMILETKKLRTHENEQLLSDHFETGKLTYGNANPKSNNFNSLADFCHSGNSVEIKIPWQLLNFYDPSEMKIHDDYYDGNYGVEEISIEKMYAGICTPESNNRITLDEIELKGWKNKATYHERLKSSYYIVKEFWTK